MNRNKKVVFIVIIIMLLLIISLFLLLELKFQKDKQRALNNVALVDYYNNYQTQRATQGITADDAVAYVEDNINEYFTVKGIIDSFNTNVSYLNATASSLNLIVDSQEEEQTIAEYKQEGLDFIKDVLASNYKVKYSVDENYIFNLLKNYSNKTYTITNMYALDDSAYINTYFIYGKYENDEFNFIVILDKFNYTYEIYLNNYFLENGYTLNKVDTMKSLHIEKIQPNDNNAFQYKNIGQEQIANMYFKDYMNLLKNNITEAYNLLDNTYKQKRFGNDVSLFQNFATFVLNNNENSRLTHYTVTKVGNYTELVCQDNLGRNFIFNVTGVMKYTAILDSYTMHIQAYDKEFKNADEPKKAQLCLNRFFESLNNRDYDTAYGFLNSTFRQSNFSTVNDFKNYVTSNWFEVDEFSYAEASKSDDNYIFSGFLSDLKTNGDYTAKVLKKTFIVKPGSDVRAFELSFDV